MRRRVSVLVVVAVGLFVLRAGATLPALQGAVRFAVIGDTGTGERPQYEVAQQMAAYHARFPFSFVIMVGDNMYGSERPQDFRKTFEDPYRALLDAGVEFYAVLGNHDDPDQRFYKPFHMNGQRYYTFSKGPVEFFALDSNYMDPKEIEWLHHELDASRAPWKICFFHHPLYSSGGRHGSEIDLRKLVEPLFVKYGVDIVFAGHDHFYERIKPQQGIAYFVEGGAAKLRKGDVRKTTFSAAWFDTDRSFMAAEISGDTFRFEQVSRTGQVVDSGEVERRRVEPAPVTAGSQVGGNRSSSSQ